MIVRMKETRLVVFDRKNPTVLQSGAEYDLPKEYAAALILEGKAEFRHGNKLRGFSHKEIAAPTSGNKFGFGKFMKRLVSLED